MSFTLARSWSAELNRPEGGAPPEALWAWRSDWHPPSSESGSETIARTRIDFLIMTSYSLPLGLSHCRRTPNVRLPARHSFTVCRGARAADGKILTRSAVQPSFLSSRQLSAPVWH